jgi:TolB-like protein/tetratricopeptide (TPR) repeat protein
LTIGNDARATVSVFVCYAHDDESRVYPLIEWLSGEGIGVWYDKGIEAGSLWRHEIAEALARSTHVLFFVSRASLSSPHCDREVQYAVDHEKRLIPVYLDAAELTPALKIALDRVQALHARRLPPEELRERVRTAILGPGGNVATQRAGRRSAGKTSRRVFVAAGVLVALLVAVGLVAWNVSRESAGALQLPERSVAVLPFVAFGQKQIDAGTAGRLTQRIVSELTRQQRAKVVSMSDVEPNPSAPAAGASYLLSGDVRDDAQGIRVTANLVRAGDRVNLWTEEYQASDLDDVDEVARLVAMTAFGLLDVDAGYVARARMATDSQPAYENFVRAVNIRVAWDRGYVAASQGLSVTANLDKAIAIDPDFVPALALKANGLQNGWLVTKQSREQALAEASALLERAAVLDPDSPDLLTMRAIQQVIELDLTAAEQTLDRLRNVDPEWPWLYENYARLAMRRGRAADALQFWELQLDRNASEPQSHLLYALVLVSEGELQKADRELATAFRMQPVGPLRSIPMAWRVEVALRSGDIAKANSLYERLISEFGKVGQRQAARSLVRLGHERELREMVEQWRPDDRSISWVDWFNAHYALHDYEAALRSLRDGLERRDAVLLMFVRLNLTPELRALPAFDEILRYVASIEKSP